MKNLKSYDGMGMVTALILWGARDQSHEQFADQVAAVLAERFRDWSDERKADLYALLAERLTTDKGFGAFHKDVAYCLKKNEQWASRHG